ncbi:sensor histidine kinase [Alicyclobacillus dauci]|uniref:histidine kinase n=1 Tax=Alicyclobacillus dauci TaxID=1475485 RepID=A0ABY6Z4Y8_9BACL|nr:HAMP domain-containing sensor histidine kinase [Alicyclobacillus dauci]WAH37947.1 HAMP domain-containing histidine kinase [Alicyclobacillus dauci]
MFRRMYLTIVGLLVVSTGLLLVLLGAAVYRELSSELTKDGQSALADQTDSVRDLVHDKQLGVRPDDPHDLRDNRGQNVYFYVETKSGVVSSMRDPIPLSVIKANVTDNHYAEISYRGDPYRLYAFHTVLNDENDPAYVYTLITEERSMLSHALSLMWTVGSIGFVVALVGDLFLAQRLMRPTQRAWTAYRDTVLELSHELQTPLATVNAMMSSRNVDAETALDVRHEIERASRMVSDMLFLSRLRSGVSQQPTEPVAVSDILEEIAERYGGLGLSQGIHISGRAEPGLFVETTPGEWERLVSTLFKNVLDHADPAKPVNWELTGDGRRVHLCIENSVAPKANGSATRSPERGVGLQIVRRLAQRMKGTLEIEKDTRSFIVKVTIPARRRLW